MEIREAIESDAQQMLELSIKLDNETKFMMMEPGERKTTVDDQAKQIECFCNAKDKLMAVSVVSGELCGFVVASSGSTNRNRHSAYMFMGVQKSYWGRGIGQALIEYLENWARSVSIHRIELTVIESNRVARELYKKCGFVEEGVKRDSLKIDGFYVNEIHMSKLINEDEKS